ncbi:glycosyltransferase family 4 protein [Roseiconus lacunae]|uniref:glycosyltransferase family 4 protein n=1 Tax=Roseiconus lacunae TaxID=2605694 RepID=UPI00308C22A5|nr:glycosyltransferase family 4 protein [Stieleria sp. HD01]
MKVAIIGHLKHPIAKPFSGGLEAFTFDYVAALRDRGHDVTLFASGDSDHELGLSSVVDVATVRDSISRLGHIDHDWIEAVEDEAYGALMDRLAMEHFDVIHNHSLSPIPLRFASCQPCPVITTLHVPPLPRMTQEVRRRGAGSCGIFVNISQANAKSWSPELGQQRIIYNGVNENFWMQHQASKENRAIWFGRILADKGTHLAIEAAHEAGMPIDVVGPISDQVYFDNEVSPRLSSEDVYHGHQDHEVLSKLIGRASVSVVTPCWDEPFGLVVTESLASGTPVAGFRRGALPEIVRQSVGRLADPGDTEDLARCINECRALDGGVCRRYVQEKFGFDRMVVAYEELYSRIELPRPLMRHSSIDGATAA